MSINGRSIHIDCWLMLEPIARMTKTLNRTMYAERDYLKLYNMYCICNPTCMHCLVNKGHTSVKSNYIKKHFWFKKMSTFWEFFLSSQKNWFDILVSKQYFLKPFVTKCVKVSKGHKFHNYKKYTFYLWTTFVKIFSLSAAVLLLLN